MISPLPSTLGVQTASSLDPIVLAELLGPSSSGGPFEILDVRSISTQSQTDVFIQLSEPDQIDQVDLGPSSIAHIVRLEEDARRGGERAIRVVVWFAAKSGSVGKKRALELTVRTVGGETDELDDRPLAFSFVLCFLLFGQSSRF